MSEENWVCFTRRTNDPKLAWLERQLDLAGIPHKRDGESWHAPILVIPQSKQGAAWAILTPAIDEMPDDHPFFTNAAQ